MKSIGIGFVSLLISALACGPAAAWGHANRYGGSTSHEQGEGTEHTNAYGGSTEHKYGGGTEHTNPYGGSTEHKYGEGTEHTNEYGDTATHAYGSGSTTYTNPYGGSATHYYGSGTTAYYGGAHYAAYHPPTTVNVYGSSCGNCGGWSTAGAAAAGAAVGVVAGTAIASANTQAATSNAYSAGYAAGATNTAYAMGAIYPTLPAGCTNPNVQGKTYYLCGNTWFLPSYGANGVYYRVVPTP
jgi:hypothetical protein